MTAKKIVVVYKEGLFVIGELQPDPESDDFVIIDKPLFMFMDFMVGKVGFVDIKIPKIHIAKSALFYFEPNDEILQKYIEHTTGLTIATTIPTSNSPQTSSVTFNKIINKI